MIDQGLFALTGSTALVTGGASGIGAAIACGLAAAGADVAITWHRRAPDDVIKNVTRAGRRAAAVNIDLASLGRSTAAQVLASARDQLGPVDILVNNAGIIVRDDSVDFGEEDWRRVMAVNLDAAWLLSQAAASGMADHGGGKIVNIASVLGFQGGIRVPAYAASKHALIGLTRALANEWSGRNINVNAIAPGYVETENTKALRDDPARMRELLARIPAGRFATADEMAGAAVFLCAPAASYVHGAVLAVDGGWLAR